MRLPRLPRLPRARVPLVVLAALLAACAPKPTPPDTPPVPRLAWTDFMFLDSGRVGFIETVWEEYEDYCASYFDWSPCTKRRAFASRFLRLDPSTRRIDTLFGLFPKKPGLAPHYLDAWYLPPRLVYRTARRLGLMNLETREHLEFGTEYIQEMTVSRSGAALVGKDSERIDIATGKVTRLLPRKLTEEPARATFAVNYHDDVSGKLVLTGTTWPEYDHTREVIYDEAAKTLDSSRSAFTSSSLSVIGGWVLRGVAVTAQGTRVAYAPRAGYVAGTVLPDTALIPEYQAHVEKAAIHLPLFDVLFDFDPLHRRALIAGGSGDDGSLVIQGFDGARDEFRVRDFRPGFFPDSMEATKVPAPW